MKATGGTATARGSTVTCGMTTATGSSTAMARGSRATGGTTMATGDTTRRHDKGDARRTTPPPPPAPPAGAAATTMPTGVILPCPGHDVTYVLCTCDLAHAGATRNGEFYRPAVPSTSERADDAATNPAGDAHDGILLCSHPATVLCPQSATAAGIFLTGRGGQ